MCVIIYNSSLSTQAAGKPKASHFFQLHRHLNRGGNDNIPLFGLFRVILTHVRGKKENVQQIYRHKPQNNDTDHNEPDYLEAKRYFVEYFIPFNTRIFYTSKTLRNMRILKIEFGKKVRYKIIVHLFFTRLF